MSSAVETAVEPTASKAGANRIDTRAAGVVGLAVMSSRLLGLVREQIFAHLYGAGYAMDAFTAAFRIPNLLRNLFAEGALSTAFVPIFTKTIDAEGDEGAWRLANKVATLAAVLLSVLILLGIIFAPLVIHFLVSGFPPEKAALTANLTRVMFPFILLVSLAALAMGILNAKNLFGVPAISASFFNIGSIIGGVFLAWRFDPHFGQRSLFGLAIGTLLGGAAQLFIQLPSLLRLGYRFRPDFAWNDEQVRQVLRLMAPAVIAASAFQVNIIVNGKFASQIPGDGPVSWLGYAFRLIQLPLGLFGVAIGTVTLPLISRSAVAKNIPEFSSNLAHGMRLAFLLTVPSTVGLMMLARPIISLLYERGHFDAVSTLRTAEALQFYAVGLIGYSGIKVLAPAFYALDKKNTPMVVSFLSIGLNLFLNWLLTFRFGMGHKGLALSTGGVAMFNFLALYFLMHRETRLLETGLMALTLAKLGLASLALALVCWAGQATLLSGWSHYGTFARTISLLGLISAAALSFFGVALALRVRELQDLADIVKRKFARVLKRAA